MDKKRVIVIVALIVLALAAWALVSHLRAVQVPPIVAEQFQWKIVDKTPAPTTAQPAASTTPQNEIVLSVAGVDVPIGTYAGSCNLIDGQKVALLSGEVSGIICTLHGKGQEIGIFTDGDKLTLMQGIASSTDSTLKRTDFVELKKL